MIHQPRISVDESQAFIETFEIEPTGEGSLTGLTFAVKDLIDIAGHKTGCGNPNWLDTHGPARNNAVCVDQLLFAGGKFVGKTISDELAFSLVGENHFYGTPLNAKAPNRVPGGSSSGSVSAVACGLVDFAIGTDTGGSVRVPASNCGVWGMRPSHGIISVAGVMPFAPTFDTVGIHASTADVLASSARVLLGLAQDRSAKVQSICLLKDAFALLDQNVQDAHQPAIEKLRAVFGVVVEECSLSDIVGEGEGSAFDSWWDTYCVVQWGEIESSLGSWIAECNPTFGPVTTKNFQLVRELDRRRIPPAIVRRERFFRKLQEFLTPGKLICIPTTPAPAPVKGSLGKDQRTGNYYHHALSLTSIAGIGRLPQISMPVSTITMPDGDAPLGLSLIAGSGQDELLLDAVVLLQDRI